MGEGRRFREPLRTDDPDLEEALIDGTFVQVYQKAIGAKEAQAQAIGRSRGGLTTRIVAIVDALGNLVQFVLLPGQAHDMKRVVPFIRDVSFGTLLANKAFDANWLIKEIDPRGATAVIPPKSNRRHQRSYDPDACNWQHLVENYFAR